MMRNIILNLSLFFLTIPVYAADLDTTSIHKRLSDDQLKVVSYFKEVALGYEYGTASAITRKWAGPINIYLDGFPEDDVRRELGKVVAELNNLMTDGVTINVVNQLSQANLHVFVGHVAKYISLYPRDIELVKNNSGVFTVSWNRQNQIIKGRVFIRNTVSLKEQRHAIREEITQCLGLGRDSVTYPESVFQLNYTIPTEFAVIDRELIRLLYHPQMKPGLSLGEVESLLTDILLSEQKL